MPLLVWSLLGAESETGAWGQVAFLGGDLRDHRLGSEERQEGKAANTECIIQQVPTMATGTNLWGGGHTSLVPAEGKSWGVYTPTHLPARVTLWLIQPVLLTDSEQIFGVRDDATRIALPYM